MIPEPILIEGYASVFGTPDLGGDVVRAGAFAASLRRRPHPACLCGHRETAPAGRWVRVQEDGHGLFVRGLIDVEAALRLIGDGVRGLSIGFFPRAWSPRDGGGRTLIAVDLVEISLVRTPMQPRATFAITGASLHRAA